MWPVPNILMLCLAVDVVATAANACGYAEHTFDNSLTLDAVVILQQLAVGVLKPML